MPAGDGTGPMGLGPMTGRRAGYCAGHDAPGCANPAVPRMGMGWRHGWGRGWRRGWSRRRAGGWGGGWRWRYGYHATGVPPTDPFAGPPTPEQEVDLLRDRAEWLKGQLEAIERRIAELEREEE
ncbi:MAG TPA: DUF5320 domain-containing protein [Thermoflexia bacterium]|nr:DUF5320 domain-containing protein [Thermoflexia bacterium]